MNGVDVIDHIGGNKKDNTITNLRKVDHRTNSRNRKIGKDNTSGTTGVSYRKGRDKWRATIINNEYKRINRDFATKGEAIKQRKDWEKDFGGYPTVSR